MSFYLQGVFLFKILSLLLLSILSLRGDENYQLGEGIQIETLPIYLGGYISLEYDKSEMKDRYSFDDIAILSYGNYEKYSYLIELEYKELYVKSKYHNTKATVTKNYQLYTERVYIDYNYNENYMLRIGKYNSNIGFWNIMPINILRETSSTPLSNSILFPTFTTGLSLSYLYYLSSAEIKIDTMIQNNSDLDAEYNNYQIDKHYGIGLSYSKDDFTFKINSGLFHKKNSKVDNNLLYYYLLSNKYETESFQLLSEFGQQYSSNKLTTEYAGYIQGSYHFTEHHSTILRVESYNTYKTIQSTQENFMIVAYTYRPIYPIALKSEYQIHSNDDLNKLLLSFSVLF